MDYDKCEQEIINLQDEMSKTSVDTEQYKSYLEAFKVLNDAVHAVDEWTNESYKIAESIEVEKLRIESENLANQMKLEQAKYEAKLGLIKALAGGGLMLAGILVTIYAEETKVITTKAWQLATHLIPRF